MSDDLRDLYQEVILDHSKRPRNFKALPGANRSAEGYNPLCGDRETVYLDLDGDLVRDVSFQGAGCAISTASASMMTERVKGMTRPQAEALFDRFHDLITSASGPSATLPWHTLKAALAGAQETVSTELTEGPKAESGGA
jgi:nitrogen fixation NifU-like protein